MTAAFKNLTATFSDEPNWNFAFAFLLSLPQYSLIV